MSIRQVSRRPLKKRSIGDRRELITLYERRVSGPSFSNAAPRIKDVTLLETWADVRTIMSYKSFDQTNPQADTERATHVFNIRYRESVTSETRIRWRDENYEILNIEDPEERREQLNLYAIIEGSITKKVNT